MMIIVTQERETSSAWRRPVLRTISASNLILTGTKKVAAAEGQPCLTYHCHKPATGCIRHIYLVSRVVS